MFKFLKDKFKKAVDSFGKKVEEETTKPSEEEIAKAVQEESTVKAETSEKKKQPQTTKKSKDARPEQEKSSTKQSSAKQQEIPTHKTKEKKQELAEKKTKEAPESLQKNPISEKFEENNEKEVKEETSSLDQKEAQTQSNQKASAEPVETKETQTKKGIFHSLKESFTKIQLSEEKFEELFWDLEMSLLENNVAVEVIEKIKNDLKKTLTEGKVTRKGLAELIEESLKKSIDELFEEPFDLVQKVQEKKPFVIAFIGVNGSGKTTTLAKIANMFQENDLSVVMAAADTFRAAAIDQLQSHANTLGIKLISQGYGADPAAVAFDAIEHAKAKNVDVVMIDTAGRLHSNTNLMAELEKVIRVAKPDLKIFIGESITGNDCVEQAEQFNDKVGIDAIILSKADIDEKGGAAISVSYVTKKPILYLGTGQSYGDLEIFDKERILRTIGIL